jgi:DNA polymerase/3'-5' exonuclease PolX
MDNRTLAKRLASTARSLARGHASLFRVRAYRRAAETILGLDYPVIRLLEEGGPKLASLPGIGRHLARTIENILRDSEMLDQKVLDHGAAEYNDHGFPRDAH